MGRARFLHDNFLDAATLTPSSTATGRVSRAQKQAAGAGDMVASGDYIGTADRDYLVQIDLAGDGQIGQSTYRWSDNDGQTLEETAVLTATTPRELSSDVVVAFVSTSQAAQYVLGDRWRFKAFLPYGSSKAVDRDPDTEWRSDDDVSAAINFVADLGSQKQPSTLILYKHNLSSTATIRLQGSAVSTFATLDVDEAVTWSEDVIAHDVTSVPRTHVYWRVRITDTANADGYLRIAEIFLGRYTVTARGFELGDIRRRRRMAQREQTGSGRWIGGLNVVVEEFEVRFEALSAADKDALLDVYDALNDATNRRIRPVFFMPDDADLDDVVLCEWTDLAEVEQNPDLPERYDLAVRLIEVPRTLA